MKQLSRMLAFALRPARPKNPDKHRAAREQAKALAAKHGIEIERFKQSDGGGMNVWPPKGLPDAADPHGGDHYCDDWTDALAMVKDYARLLDVLEPASTATPEITGAQA